MNDTLPSLLREWAQWYEKTMDGLGHADSTTVYRAMLGAGGGEFQSCVPSGISKLEIRGELRELVEAMDNLCADPAPEITEPVITTQAFYLCGAPMITEVTGMGKTKIYSVVSTGEALIRREMRLC